MAADRRWCDVRRWTPEEDAKLDEMVAAGREVWSIACEMRRTRQSVRQRILGHREQRKPDDFPHPRPARWTPTELEVMRRWGGSVVALAAYLGRPVGVVKRKCRAMGLHVRGNRWTADEDALLLANAEADDRRLSALFPDRKIHLVKRRRRDVLRANKERP